jgi:alpha-beta hydrolase superfamily lysophospholipase
MPATEFFKDADGVEVAFYRWMPDAAPKAVVCIAHGASEHGARYDRFASFLAAHGFAVFAQDHRGHGNTAKATGVGIAGPREWDGVIDDQHEMVQLARREVPGVKLILFGHSMGSFLAQAYVERYGDEIDGLVLSGSSGGMGDRKTMVDMLDAVIADSGADSPSPGFGSLNDQFTDARTAYDWLSRDPAEVDKYIADPFCGDDIPLSLGYVRGMIDALGRATESASPVRKDLPVLFITGEMDPVSQNAASVRELEARWRAYGVADLTALYYPEARHELLNETNRDEVQNDLLAWIERVAA